MVDFQSRDTSRAVDEDDPEESEGSQAESQEGSTGENADTQSESEQTGSRTIPPDSDEQVAIAILIADDEADATEDVDDVVDALAAEHEVLGRDRRSGGVDSIQSAVNTFLDQPSVDAIVTVGGVSVGPAQATVDAVEPLLDTGLPGFGEQFRRRYAEQAGSAALRTRAFAGIADGKPVFCLPSDGDAASTATAELVAPELDWVVAAAGES